MNLREFFERYGVSIGVLGALALLIAVLPGNSSSNAARVGTTGGAQSATQGTGSGSGTGAAAGSATATGGAVTAGGPGAAAGGAAGGSAGPGAAAGGSAAGGGGAAASSVAFGQGANCRPDGRQVGISLYMPPCAEWQGTDNGGATADGVTGNQVKVIRWLGQLDDATKAILQANKLGDADDVVARAYKALFSYSNHHYETYGREVVFEDYQASAISTNQEAMIADAAQIADKHPFAVMEGNPATAMPTVLARELNARGVLCLCTTSLSTPFYQENPLVMSTGLPSGADYCKFAAEYVGKRLAGKNAAYAGDELNPLQGFKSKPRVFGLMYLNGALGQVDPEGERLRATCEKAFADYGVSFAVQLGYIYDPGRNQNDVSNMMAQMKAAGVTTIVPLVDPLSPILITPEATRQNYFPEWFVTGTGLSDTTTAGRLYDQNQWRHAFGMTPLWVTWTNHVDGPGYREYHDARRGDAENSEGVLIEIYRARVQTLFRGIHLAGPVLNQDTFRQGLFSYPPTPSTGGTAGLPYVYYTPDSPMDIKDFAEVFYDITQQGPDERGEFGTGMMMKSDNGKRYQLGQWPSDDPHVYKPGAMAISDNPEGGSNPPFTPGPEYGESGCLSCH
ncbi:MAG: hypothetical protein QOJ67_136 [Acidimicrobiaceae bacterium]